MLPPPFAKGGGGDFVSRHTWSIPPGPPLSKGEIEARPWPTRSLVSTLRASIRNGLTLVPDWYTTFFRRKPALALGAPPQSSYHAGPFHPHPSPPPRPHRHRVKRHQGCSLCPRSREGRKGERSVRDGRGRPGGLQHRRGLDDGREPCMLHMPDILQRYDLKT
jgi:hypothetical protein